ncbi:MAG TPA: tetratricopeptide repeat protein [Clostridia bacterium]|nr:tetratricopeptide repeat protein [Clostridia bacterium]
MKNKIFSQTAEFLLAAVVFFLPLIFLPYFTDGFDFGKQIFLLLACLVVFLVWTLQTISEKKLIYKKSHYLFPVLLILVAFLASTFVNSSNKTQSFAAATGAGAVLISTLLYLLLNSLGKRKTILYSLLGSGLVLSLLRVVLFLGDFSFPLNYPSLNLSITKAWSPTGSLIAQAVFLLALIPLGFSLMYENLRQQKLLSAGAIFLLNTLNLVGLGLSFHLLTTTAQPILLPQSTAWAIALEGLKNGRFAALGLGPGQFVNAFTSFKSLNFNNTDFWNLRFGSSSNWYYQLLTEVGIIGLVAYLFLGWRIFRDGIRVFRKPRISYTGLASYLALIILLITQFFIPLNFFLLALVFILLAVARDEEQVSLDFSAAGGFAFLGLVLPLAFWGGTLFFAGKLALANHYFLNSLKAAAQNDGVTTYNLQIKAIQADPASANYRIAYSQTNLALANSLATKQELTDQDRSTITQLVQQAIREAKAAVAVDPRNVVAWENLANLYRNLINFAEGADQWALASYQQAINLDPLNPRLRVDLGGLYYSQQNWQQAANLFAQAVNLKPDWANAHYNLANVLREAGDLAGARQEYEVSQSLVPIDSNDYQKVSSELEEVKKRLPIPTPTPKTQEPSEPETLVTPAPPAEGIEPPLELPEEGSPPVTPTPEAQP